MCITKKDQLAKLQLGESAIKNAQGVLKIQKEFGSLDTYLWGSVNGQPIQNEWKSMAELPAKTELSEKMSKDLKKRGFNFVGPTTAALLMKQLTEFRISPSETNSAFIFRLVALFDDLECVPGDASYEFKDVQKTGYLLSAIAHEPDLRQMHLHIQTSLSRGSITFEQACIDLQIQCDDARAQEILTNGGSASRPRRSRALISTKAKSRE